MVIMFTEADLVSFGEYMISQNRKDFYINNPTIQDNLEELLSQVNNIDLENWMRISNTPQQESTKSNLKLVN